MTTNAKNYPPNYNYHGTPPRLGWYERQQKNKPQLNSLGSAALIFVSGGMSVSWGLWSPSSRTVYMNICWFVTAIVGAVLGGTLTNKMRKKLFMFLSSLLVLTGGVLFVTLPQSSAAVMVARHLNGFAVGFAFVPAIVMAGEEAVRSRRGMLSSAVDTVGFSLGMYIQVIYAATWYDQRGFTSYKTHGVLCIILGSLAFLFALFVVIESPVFLLLRGREVQAIDSLRRLQKPFVVTYETYEQLEEHKQYIAENKEKTAGQSFMESLSALFKLSIFRILIAMSVSFLMISALITSSEISQGESSIWAYIIYGLCRLIATLITIFTIDPVGRKAPLICSMVICGALAIALGILFNNLDIVAGVNKMAVALILLLVFQFFSGVGATSSSAYLSEAFPLAVKPYCIATAFSAEMIVHIIILTVNLNHNSITGFLFAVGGLYFMFALMTILCLPETKRTTLLEAQRKFRHFLSFNREH